MKSFFKAAWDYIASFFVGLVFAVVIIGSVVGVLWFVATYAKWVAAVLIAGVLVWYFYDIGKDLRTRW